MNTESGKLAQFGRRLLTTLVACIVLTATGVIALVVVGTQVGFYRTQMRTQTVDFGPLGLGTLDLAVFTPLATESITWMCTLMAVVLIVFNKKAVRWMRAAWMFAAISAFVNFVHATVLNHELVGGFVTGGLSFALPYVVHLFVRWVRQLKLGRTEEQENLEADIRWAAIWRTVRTVALTLLDHVVHPLTALRTIWVWRTYRGIRYQAAWFIASKPLRERVRRQYGTRPGQPVPMTTDDPVPSAPVERAPEIPEDVPHGGVLAAVRADDEGVRDDVDDFLAKLNDEHGLEALVRTWSEEARAHGASSGNSVQGTPDADTDARSPEIAQKPHSKRAQKAKSTGGKRRGTAVKRGESTTARDLITAEYWSRVHAGKPTDPEAVDFSAMAREYSTSRTTVSKTWKACLAGERPDPGQQQTGGDGQ